MTGLQVNKCLNCGHRGPYVIIRMNDCLVAECQRCRMQYDIGWKTEGYVS